MSEEIKAIGNREVEEMWNNGHLEVAIELYADNYVMHLIGLPEVKGVQGIKQVVTAFRTAFPDLHFHIDDVITEGDRGAWRWTATGTHLGEWAGISPTGRKVKFTGIGIDRYDGGKIAESWANMDDLGLMKQLGVVTNPAVSEANKAVARRYIEEMLNQGNLALVEDLFSSDSFYHGPNVPKLRGREPKKQFSEALRKAFPDLHFTLDDLTAEGNRVVGRWSFVGTHRGEWLGATATNKKASCSGTTTFQLVDGMITDEFVHLDSFGLMQQLGALPASTEANKALVQRYVNEILNKHNLAAIDEIFTVDAIYCGPNLPELRGREARRRFAESFLNAFPDFHLTVDELISEGNKIAVRYSCTGTHQGEFWGAVPTGKKLSWSGTSTFWFADGMITDEFVYLDALGLMQQLGVVPAVSQSAGAAR